MPLTNEAGLGTMLNNYTFYITKAMTEEKDMPTLSESRWMV